MSRRALGSDADLRRTARRIGLQTAGLLMACLVVVGAVLYGLVVRSQDEQLTSSLSDAVATAGMGRDPDHDHDHDLSEPRGGIQHAVLDGRGLRTSTGLAPGLPDLDVLHAVASTHVPDRRTLNLPSGGFEILTVQRGDDTVQVIASTYEQHQERERILGALGLAGGAGLLLATLAAAFLARRAVRPMAQALEQQRRFVADAGHELRTPLTLLSTRSQLLARRVRDTTSPAAQREELVERDAAGIVADTAALVAILEDLLTEADDRTPVPQVPVDLAEVARSVVGSAQATAQQDGVVLRTEVDPAAPTVVHGAATALTRAVAALVDNALDHAAGEVEVRLSHAGRSVVVEVLDDGPGIPGDTLPRMFDRFSSDRRPVAETGERRHFGLGLALVSEIATRHGGSVTAENRPAPRRGALLRLTLPAVPTARSAHRLVTPRGVIMSNDQPHAGLEPGGHPDEPHAVGGLARQLNWLRAGVLGANDGIVSVAAVVIGVAGAGGGARALETSGLAALVGGALSMALGEYVSVSSQRDAQTTLIAKERLELATEPEAELDELAGLYEERGLSPATARQVAVELTAHDALAAHLSAELNLSEDDVVSAGHAAFASALSFLVGGLIPFLAVVLLPASARVPLTFVAVLLALALTGYLSARVNDTPRLRPVARLVGGGAVALMATFAIGSAVGAVAG